MKFLFLPVFLLVVFVDGKAQDCFCGKSNATSNDIQDGSYLKTHIATKFPIPYENVREADMIWSTRMWSFIDVREKINQPLFYPLDEITPDGTWITPNDKVSLWTLIRCNVLAGNLQIFSPFDELNVFGKLDGDQLKYPVQPIYSGGNFYTDSTYRAALMPYFGELGPESDIPLVDEQGDPIIIQTGYGAVYQYPPRDTIWYTSSDIVQYRIKEDWFFDKERGSLDRRIIAIAPVIAKKETNSNGDLVISGTKELFWLYFPHLRYTIANYQVYNAKNDAQWMSFDDLFWKRRFHSVVYKESNLADREIDSYAKGVDALLESERIKEAIRNLESDVWQY